MEKMVASWTPPPRRKTKAELAQMSHDARLMYEIFEAPQLTEHEQQAALERELKGLDEMTWADQQEGPIDDKDWQR